MSINDKESDSKLSLEERIKSNVALWFLGALATGFAAGIAAVKWSDERYKVEPIPIAERDALVKAQSDLVALQRVHRDLEARNAELKEAVSKQKPTLESASNRMASEPAVAVCISQRSELESLKESYTKSQAELSAALKSCGSAPAVSGTSFRPSELSTISITLNYATKRLADANMISERLGPDFKDLQLVVCAVGCNRNAQIIYGYDLSAPVAFSVARLLAQAGVLEFSQPMISRGEGPHKMTIYLSD